ncbi:restriction endonuclease [Arthrobacter sp. MDT1-65]
MRLGLIRKTSPCGGGRAHWAVYNSFRAGLLDRPDRRTFVISEDGKEAVASQEPVTYETLRKNAEYVDWLRGTARRRREAPEGGPVEVVEDSEETPEESLAEAASQINEALIEDIYLNLLKVHHRPFENLILMVVDAMGYGTNSKMMQRTGGSGDNGIDGIIWQDALGFDKVYLQAKRYSHNDSVGPKDVRDFGGALMQKRANKGIFITTASYSSSAVTAAEEISGSAIKIVLIDGRRLAELMFKYRVGVQPRTPIVTYQLDEAFFDNLLDKDLPS